MPDFGEIARQAEALRHELRLPSGPIQDIVAVLRQLGLKVVLKRLGRRGPDGMYVRRGSLGFVLLNSAKYLPRFRFTAAHECGHHVLGHRVAVDQDVIQTHGDPQEQAANSFAAALLVPESALRERVAHIQRVDAPSVLDMATEFGVSYETLVYRLHNCGLLRGGYQRRDDLLTNRIAVVPESLEMQAPSERTVLPTEYVRWAVAAYLGADITLERLAELIEADATQLERLFSAEAGEHGDETP